MTAPPSDPEGIERCPYCKRDGEDLLASSDGADDGWFYFVECYCGASGPRCRTRQEANRLWNRVARIFGTSLGGAPDGWEDPRWRVMIECRTCGFEMGAIHEEPANRPTTCPSCEEDRLRADAEKWRELAREACWFIEAGTQEAISGVRGGTGPDAGWLARFAELEKEEGGDARARCSKCGESASVAEDGYTDPITLVHKAGCPAEQPPGAERGERVE